MSIWKSLTGKSHNPNTQDNINTFIESDFNSWDTNGSWRNPYPTTRTHYRPTLYGYIAIAVANGKTDYYYLDSAQQRDAIVEHAKDWSMIKPFSDDIKDCRIDNRDIKDDDRIVCINANELDLQWRTSQRSVATCVYNATDDYMGHMFGMAMDSADKNWYSQYDKKVTSHGCVGSWILTVIQQLIEPYDLTINHVRIKPGSMRYEEHRTFMVALGANPFFVQDGTTTNRSALTQMGIEFNSPAGQKLINGWRFDCAEDPIGPCICLDQFDGYGIGAHSGGAFYIGPRGQNNKAGFRMSINLGRTDLTSYHQDLVLDSYEEHPGSRTPILGSLRIGDSTLAKLSTHNRSYNSGTFHKTPTNPFPYISGDGEINSTLKDLELEYPPVCEHCQRAIDGAKITTEWGQGRCPHCNNVLEKNWKSSRSL